MEGFLGLWEGGELRSSTHCGGGGGWAIADILAGGGVLCDFFSGTGVVKLVGESGVGRSDAL